MKKYWLFFSWISLFEKKLLSLILIPPNEFRFFWGGGIWILPSSVQSFLLALCSSFTQRGAWGSETRLWQVPSLLDYLSSPPPMMYSFGGWGLHLAVPRTYTLLCTQDSLLAVLRGPFGVLGIKPGVSCAQGKHCILSPPSQVILLSGSFCLISFF